MKSTNIDNDNAYNTSPDDNRNKHNSNQSINIQEDAMKKIDLIKTLLVSCDDWVTIDYLLKVLKRMMSSY